MSIRRDRVILSEVSFRCGRGVLVVAGPNGAGKSTLLSVLATTLTPSSGQATLGGRSLSPTRHVGARGLVGYLPQNADFPGWFTGRDAVEYAAWLGRVAPGRRMEATNSALTRVGASGFADQKLRAMSSGQRRLVFLAQSMVHGPLLLLLDEPTAGIDTEHRAQIRYALTQWGRRGIVLLATHLVEEIEILRTRVIVLGKGKVCFEGGAADLARLGERVETFPGEGPVEAGLRVVAQSSEAAEGRA